MSCANCAFQQMTLPLPLQTHRRRPSISSNSGRNGRNPTLPLLQIKPHKLLGNPGFRISCSVSSDGGIENLVNRLPKFSLGADKVFRLIANATASSICQFVPLPVTFLHSVDPRIKLVRIGTWHWPRTFDHVVLALLPSIQSSVSLHLQDQFFWNSRADACSRYASQSFGRLFDQERSRYRGMEYYGSRAILLESLLYVSWLFEIYYPLRRFYYNGSCCLIYCVSSVYQASIQGTTSSFLAL